jgi:hypothetical protein
LVTSITLPPRPPTAWAPWPSAPGKARRGACSTEFEVELEVELEAEFEEATFGLAKQESDNKAIVKINTIRTIDTNLSQAKLFCCTGVYNVSDYFVDEWGAFDPELSSVVSTGFVKIIT